MKDKEIKKGAGYLEELGAADGDLPKHPADAVRGSGTDAGAGKNAAKRIGANHGSAA